MSDLGIQLFFSDFLLREEVTPVINDPDLAIRMKPKSGTGLWTSTWREETQDSAWVEWCRDNDFGSPDTKHWYLLTPRPDARLFLIDSLRDLEAWILLYPLITPLTLRYRAISPHLGTAIDFEAMSAIYDGVHLTDKGNGETHLSYPHNLNGWDCESTLWFHWCFDLVQHIRTPEVQEEESKL